MRIFFFMLIGGMFSFAVEKTSKAFHFYNPGETISILPFKIINFKESQNFEVISTCTFSQNNVQLFSKTFIGTGAQVNEFFDKEIFIVPAGSTSDLHVGVDVIEAKSSKKISVSHTSALSTHIPVHLKVNKTNSDSPYPMRVAEIMPPFDKLSLSPHHVEPKDLFNITIYQGGIELDLLNKEKSFGNLTFVLQDDNSNLKSHVLKIEVVPLIKSGNKKIYHIALLISIVTILLIIVAMFIQSRLNKSPRKADLPPLTTNQSFNRTKVIAVKASPTDYPVLKN